MKWRASLIQDWIVRFKMADNGYVYDPFVADWVFNPKAAEDKIVDLRASFIGYLGI